MILGVDTGLATLGLAWLDGDKVHRVQVLETHAAPGDKKSDDVIARCMHMQKMMHEVWNDTWFLNVELVCVEALSYPRSSIAACMIGMCWGLLVSQCAFLGKRIAVISPQRVRASIVGLTIGPDGKRAAIEKDTLHMHVRQRVGDMPPGMEMIRRKDLRAHAWDAIAVGLACPG